jgi:hypothetical protein
MMRLKTFFGALAFLALMGAVMFLMAGTANLRHLAVYWGFACSHRATCGRCPNRWRARAQAWAWRQTGAVYNIGSAVTWIRHIVIVHWIWDASTGGGFRYGCRRWRVGHAGGDGAARLGAEHNDYLSARSASRGARTSGGDDGRLTRRHPNTRAGCCSPDGGCFGSWPSIPPLLIWIGLLVYARSTRRKSCG